MAPVGIPLWKGRMKNDCSLWGLTDEIEIVLEGIRVEGAKRGVNEEVWGDLRTAFYIFSIKGIHLLHSELFKNHSNQHAFHWFAGELCDNPSRLWFRNMSRIHATMSEYVIVIHAMFIKKTIPSVPSSVIGYITYMSCISCIVLWWQ